MLNFYTFTYDVETTGLSTEDDRIVEIAWILLDESLDRVDADTQLINPRREIPPDAYNIHGIKNSMVLDKPDFKTYFVDTIAPILTEYDPMIGGFNSKRFDDEIFQQELKRNGIDIPITEFNSLDVGTLFKKLHPRDLHACAMEYLGEEEVEKMKLWFRNNREPRGDVEGFHTAEFDTVMTVRIIKSMFDRHEELPTEPDELNEFIHRSNPNDVDIDGKFQWQNGRVVITFGKHSGSPLKSIAVHNKGYLKWILKNEFPQSVKKVCEDALNGIFPEPPEHIESE